MAPPEVDVEAARNESEYLQGFADFSHYIASDLSLSIYRRFGALGARNLLYFQTELQCLELKLESLDKEDKSAIANGGVNDETLEIEKGARSWEVMVAQAENGAGRQAKRVELMYKIRELMREYGAWEGVGSGFLSNY